MKTLRRLSPGLVLLAFMLIASPAFSQCDPVDFGIISWWDADLVDSDVVPVAPGVVNWWDADLVSGSTAIDRAGSDDGAFVNGATTAPGFVGQGFSFDGVNDHIRIPDSPTLQFGIGEMSVTAWFKAPLGSTFRSIVAMTDNTDCRGGFFLWIDNVGRLSGFFGDATASACGHSFLHRATAPGRLDDDTFHHGAAVRLASGEIRLYVDGVLSAVTTALPASTVDSSSDLFIGMEGSFGNFPFEGLVDEVQIYDRALSAAEILHLGGGSAAVDRSGANDGTFVNGATTAPDSSVRHSALTGWTM